ncbi:hypothetical protein MHYP_G00247820 [Metynnis hypsauchen]
MSQSDYDDLICFEELNRADQDEMVVVVYECVDAVRGRDPNTETEDINTKRILQTGRITLMYFMAHIQEKHCRKQKPQTACSVSGAAVCSPADCHGS